MSTEEHDKEAAEAYALAHAKKREIVWWYIPKSVKPASKQGDVPEGWYKLSYPSWGHTKEELENLDTVITEEVRAYYNRNPC